MLPDSVGVTCAVEEVDGDEVDDREMAGETESVGVAARDELPSPVALAALVPADDRLTTLEADAHEDTDTDGVTGGDNVTVLVADGDRDSTDCVSVALTDALPESDTEPLTVGVGDRVELIRADDDTDLETRALPLSRADVDADRLGDGETVGLPEIVGVARAVLLATSVNVSVSVERGVETPVAAPLSDADADADGDVRALRV